MVTKNFGEEISCEIPKNGDLINDLILNTLPSVSLTKTDTNEEVEQSYNDLFKQKLQLKILIIYKFYLSKYYYS